MKDYEQKKAAKKFAEYWKDRGYEKGESQPFWLSLLRSVFGVEEPEKFIQFENPVLISHMSFIDAYIPASRVMIEQKGRDKDLRKGIKQSDGSFLTPFQQAQRYIPNLPVDLHPRYIITCNFQTFLIYDMQHPLAEPAEIKLADLEKEYYRLKFIVEGAEKAHIKREEELSIKAGEIVGKLYSALEKQYADVLSEGDTAKLSAEVRSWLNKLCVRLVFCFYAEDAGVFGKKNMFHDYLAGFHVQNVRDALIKLFTILDTQEKDRDPFDTSPASAFPYVNGGLFSNCSSKEVPPLTKAIVTIILNDCCDQFDWSEISPTIFGAVFESTLNQETRRSGGMHYTSIENIHKVIDPLFLDDLKREYAELCEIKLRKSRRAALAAFQDKLASLHFLDPAAGSGNFLTESYLCLRKIENDLLRRLVTDDEGEGILLADIKVNISQFYGIEINDFAVSVAKTALWIAESQMMNVTESIIGATRDFLPLKTSANIVEGNALRLDWKEIVPPEKLNYIMGNPPFVGASLMTKEQKDDAVRIYGKIKRANSLDYVGAWYYKTADYIQNTDVRTAFVSTNSLTQGEQVAPFWEKLLGAYGLHIDFAWRTFKWNSESSDKAAVHCVIIGFSQAPMGSPKRLYQSDASPRYAKNINPYLTDAPNTLIQSRSKPICSVPPITYGNKPSDGGNLILSQAERDELLTSAPELENCVRRYIGSRDYINNDEQRWCLWLCNVPASTYRHNREIMRRLEAVREFRLNSTAAPTRAAADRPYSFFSAPQKDSPCLCVPEVSSERRRYIPMGFLPSGAIASNKLLIIPDAGMYHLGVLISNVHMAWMRVVAGRLEMRYQYSGSVVYNTFPWPNPTPEQKARIEQTAQGILDARALYPDSSLADLYDDLTMPPELRKAHQENDKAVMTAYGFDWRSMTEHRCVAELMKMYTELVRKQ